jgi:D-alanyl-D-alanine carboxypeptidase (penicillin-binding protein 5/6)
MKWAAASAALGAAVCLFSAAIPIAHAADVPAVQAASAVLMDADTRVVLLDKAMHERRPVASTTKVMTALLALEHGKLSDRVTVSPSVLSLERGSNVGLQPGDVVTMDDLLKSVLLASGNDAAVAVAEHIGGSVQGFADMMNARAAKLGAADTHFVNPHGLYDPNHYSSAYDLGLITAAAFAHPRFAELVASKVVEVSLSSAPEGVVQLINHNRLLWRADFVDGVKTGFVKESGHCLIASGSKNGWRLIAVVLDSPDMYADAKALLDYGFATFQRQVYARAGNAVGRAAVRSGTHSRVPAVAERTLACVTGPGLTDEGCRLLVKVEKLTAPVAKGAWVGEARLVSGARTLAASPLLAGEEVGRSWLKIIAIWLFWIVFVAAAFVFSVRTGAKIVKARRFRRRLLATESGRSCSGGPRQG